MKHWKLNRAQWRILGLAVLLGFLCIVSATGTAFARYRAKIEGNVLYQGREPVKVYLGQVEYPEGTNPETARTEGNFVQTDGAAWERNENGALQLPFAIANGLSEEDCETRSQEATIRVIGGSGLVADGQVASLKLSFPYEEEDPTEPTGQTEPTDPVEQLDGMKHITATPVRIGPDAALYSTYGDSWMFLFLDENGEEWTWPLEGGELEYVEMYLSVEGTLTDASLLQLQVSSRYVED